MLILNPTDVVRAVPMPDAIEAMKWAYRAWSSGKAVVPARIHLDLPDAAGVTLVMPAYVPGDAEGPVGESLIVKIVSVCPGNATVGLPTIQGIVQALDPRTGQCLALLDGATLTAIRTGAGSGAATDLLARRDATSLAILGAGIQARTQLQAVCCVRSIEQVRIFDHLRAKAEELARDLAGRDGVPSDVQVVDSAEAAVRDADVVCTATPATEPTFDDAHLARGAHVNAVGAFRTEMREIPAETLARAKVFVDHREAALSEAGDLIQAIGEGAFAATALRGEIGQALGGSIRGRTDDDEITVFKSVGMAAQDAVAAAVALANARVQGIGQALEWEL